MLLLSNLLRNASCIEAAILRSLDVTLATSVAKTIKQTCLDKTEELGSKMPSKATMSRMRGLLDFSFMLCMRQQHYAQHSQMSTGTAVYIMGDSSPQGGYDWMMTSRISIQGSQA